MNEEGGGGVEAVLHEIENTIAFVSGARPSNESSYAASAIVAVLCCFVLCLCCVVLFCVALCRWSCYYAELVLA